LKSLHPSLVSRVIQEHISYWLMIEKVHVTDVDVSDIANNLE